MNKEMRYIRCTIKVARKFNPPGAYPRGWCPEKSTGKSCRNDEEKPLVMRFWNV